jgi:hypothetical protein
VGWRLSQEYYIQTLSVVLPQLVKKDGEAVGIEARELPPAGLARGGLDRGLEPVILIERLNDLDRLHPSARETAADRQLQAEPAFVLAEDPHRLRGRLSA